MNDSVQDGKLQQIHWVFYPYGPSGPLFPTENALLEVVPTYAKRFLMPRRESLAGRAGHTRADRHDWWGLSWDRSSWALDSGPRLVSKYFGGPGGFATDLEAQFIVVQGFVWFPKWMDALDGHNGNVAAVSTEDLLCAYAALMNSQRF